MEIELQLTFVLGHERTQRGLERHVAIELRCELLDRREIRERVKALGAGRRGRRIKPHLSRYRRYFSVMRGYRLRMSRTP